MSEENNKIDSSGNHEIHKENHDSKNKIPKSQKRSPSKFLVGLLIILTCFAFAYRNNVYIIDYLDLEYLIRSYKNEDEPAIFGNSDFDDNNTQKSELNVENQDNIDNAETNKDVDSDKEEKQLEELPNNDKKEDKSQEVLKEEKSNHENSTIPAPVKMSYMKDASDAGDDKSDPIGNDSIGNDSKIDVATNSGDVMKEDKPAQQETDEPRHIHYQDNFMIGPEPPLLIVDDIDAIRGGENSETISSEEMTDMLEESNLESKEGKEDKGDAPANKDLIIHKDNSSDDSQHKSKNSDNQSLGNLSELDQYAKSAKGYSDFAPAIPNDKIFQNAAKYRVYLKNAGNLINKFRMGETYSDELSFLKAPLKDKDFLEKEFDDKYFNGKYKAVEEFIGKLEKYNKLLLDAGSSRYEEVSLGGQLLSNFIKVRKENVNYKAVLEMKHEIEQEMQLFNEFLYSEQLQDLFLLKSI